MRRMLNNLFPRAPVLLQVFVLAYGLTLAAFEYTHTVGGLPTDLYLLFCRTLLLPIVWLVEQGRLGWLAELLKWAAMRQ